MKQRLKVRMQHYQLKALKKKLSLRGWETASKAGGGPCSASENAELKKKKRKTKTLQKIENINPTKRGLGYPRVFIFSKSPHPDFQDGSAYAGLLVSGLLRHPKKRDFLSQKECPIHGSQRKKELLSAPSNTCLALLMWTKCPCSTVGTPGFKNVSKVNRSCSRSVASHHQLRRRLHQCFFLVELVSPNNQFPQNSELSSQEGPQQKL
ncbi:hypothetical protein E2320_012188 [Naja naja]|nr:hypothetical protein E2320_012188 [Naja naja]